jgi:hypothetical protein
MGAVRVGVEVCIQSLRRPVIVSDARYASRDAAEMDAPFAAIAGLWKINPYNHDVSATLFAAAFFSCGNKNRLTNQ